MNKHVLDVTDPYDERPHKCRGCGAEGSDGNPVTGECPTPYQSRSDLLARIAHLESLINTPHTDEWFEAVRLEAAHQVERWGSAHQVERWGSAHDAGKQPSDWFWLLGYLGGKALAAAIKGDHEKAKHHTISTGAACLNWFRAMTGDSNAMRPGSEQ